MDLVEVAPNDRPPVCRIMDYGKWKYRQKKKEQKARQAHHEQQLKEVRLRPKTDTHDRDFKVNHARDFLEEGDRVQFTMLFRGREMAHQDIGRNTMLGIAEELNEISKVDTPPRMAGRRMTMILMPIKKQQPSKKSKAGGGEKTKDDEKPQAAEVTQAESSAEPAAGETQA